MKQSTNKVFMAFAGGKESTESTSAIKRFVGVGAVYARAINPNKAELEKLYGTTIENEPTYLGTAEVGPEGNKKVVDQVRIDVIVEFDGERHPIAAGQFTKFGFFLRNCPSMTADGNKIQIINKYGETTWVPVIIDGEKNVEFKGAPEWFEMADVRWAYNGEDVLTNFLKAYLNIPLKSFRKGDGTVVEIENKKDAEARLDGITNYFKGDFSELSSAIKLQPMNRVKAAFGVKTTTDNKQYQDVYVQKFLKFNMRDYSKLEQEIKERQERGGYPNTVFEVGELKEFTNEPTTFAAASTAPAPTFSPEFFKADVATEKKGDSPF